MRCSDLTENIIQTGFGLEFSNEIYSATPFAQTGRMRIKEEGLNYSFLCVPSVQQRLEFSTVDSSGIHNYYCQSNDLRVRKECNNLQRGNVKYTDKTFIPSHTIIQNAAFQGD